MNTDNEPQLLMIEMRKLIRWVRPAMFLSGLTCFLVIGMCIGVVQGASSAAFRLKALRDENASLREENAKLRTTATLRSDTVK